MLLVSSKLSHEKVTIDTSSPEGLSRIHVIFDKGKPVTVEPASTILFMGGG
jgi:hypothetical protein